MHLTKNSIEIKCPLAVTISIICKSEIIISYRSPGSYALKIFHPPKPRPTGFQPIKIATTSLKLDHNNDDVRFKPYRMRAVYNIAMFRIFCQRQISAWEYIFEHFSMSHGVFSQRKPDGEMQNLISARNVLMTLIYTSKKHVITLN